MQQPDQEFIKISQVVGKRKLFASLSVWQFVAIAVCLLLVWVLYLLKIDPLKAALMGTWILGAIWLLTGDRPDRIIKRLFGRPRHWKRGFRKARPLLGEELDVRKSKNRS
jgi:hypothetical protein